MKLDLGGGYWPREGYKSVDIVKEADIHEDLEFGLVMMDDSIEAIFASHLMEHIKNFLPLMNDCWRVLVPTGYIEIIVPRFPHLDSVVDPTHVRFFVSGTFHYFNYQNVFCDLYGIKPWHLLNLGESDNEVYCKMEPYKGNRIEEINLSDSGPFKELYLDIKQSIEENGKLTKDEMVRLAEEHKSNPRDIEILARQTRLI